MGTASPMETPRRVRELEQNMTIPGQNKEIPERNPLQSSLERQVGRQLLNYADHSMNETLLERSEPRLEQHNLDARRDDLQQGRVEQIDNEQRATRNETLTTEREQQTPSTPSPGTDNINGGITHGPDGQSQLVTATDAEEEFDAIYEENIRWFNHQRDLGREPWCGMTTAQFERMTMFGGRIPRHIQVLMDMSDERERQQ